MEQDIIIVGAGASGLMAAIGAAGRGSRVLVLEQKDKAGKKIMATGNGKCNFTNLYQAPECYRSEDNSFAMKVLSAFDVQQTISFFQELGILPKEREGYLYPNSEQAASIVQVLLMECRRLGVRFIYEEKVIEIKTLNHNSFRILTEKLTEPGKGGSYEAKKLILAAGGCASPKLGSDGSGYILAKSLGHGLIKPLPALVQLKSPNKFLKTLSGVRTIGRVTVYTTKDGLTTNYDNKLSEEQGELIFTDYGISGIPILQISRYVAKALDRREHIHLLLDFLPQYNKKEVSELLRDRIRHGEGKNLEETMVGLFNHKLSYIMIKEAGLDPYQNPSGLKDKEVALLTSQIKEFRLIINDTNSFENAQVSAGGIPTSELEATTLESKQRKNLYLCGELVDVDGTCGGYNLQWAWSSGYLAGVSAAV